ncbi:hypothetical protein F3D3_3085 [Fusibacter sp. 3D3]|nr:hypothetical protein F3D3_3085 [Fusibacter sp. 3D3]
MYLISMGALVLSASGVLVAADALGLVDSAVGSFVSTAFCVQLDNIPINITKISNPIKHFGY